MVSYYRTVGNGRVFRYTVSCTVEQSSHSFGEVVLLAEFPRFFSSSLEFVEQGLHNECFRVRGRGERRDTSWLPGWSRSLIWIGDRLVVEGWSRPEGSLRGCVFLQLAEEHEGGMRRPQCEVYVLGLHARGARGPASRVADVLVRGTLMA